jgi:hypothetical protein
LRRPLPFRAVSPPPERSPTLSIVVVAHDMARELPRTLRSLSPGHQRRLAAEDYEVLVVDNGSTPAVSRELAASFGGRLRLERIDPAPPCSLGLDRD